MVKNKVRALIGFLFYATLVVFLYHYLKGLDYSALSAVFLDPFVLLAACGLSLTSRLWGAFVWRRLLIDLGAERPRWTPLLFIYGKSWLGRYLPGKVTWIVGKVYFARQLGVPNDKLIVGASLEALIQLLVMLALSMALLSLDGRSVGLGTGATAGLLLLAVGLGIVLIPAVLGSILRVGGRLIHTAAYGYEVQSRAVINGVGYYVVGFFISGGSMLVFTCSLYPDLDPDLFLYVLAVFNLAGAVGIVAFFAPGGIGVREGVLLVLLDLAMPREMALMVVVASRVFLVVMDLVFFVLSYLLAVCFAHGEQ